MSKGSWTLYIRFSRINEIVQHEIPITFSSTRKIDYTETNATEFDLVNTLLSPTMAPLALQALARGVTLDFWELTHWMFVSGYWTTLADLGQITTTTYARPPMNYPYPPDYSSPIQHPATYNIFVNETLFALHYEYMLNVILPFLGFSRVPRLAPIDDENFLSPTEATFIQTYPCNVRVMKTPLSAIVSVVVADYAFIKGAYSLFIFAAAWYEKRKAHEGCPLVLEFVDLVGNFCDGCVNKPFRTRRMKAQ